MSHTTFMSGLGYEGKVTLTLKSNNRVLKSRTYKNKGTEQLFRFFGYCLLGDFEDASQLLPNKIMLLHNNSDGNPASALPQNVDQRSAFRGFTQAPLIVSDSLADQTDQVRVIFSFEVPRAAISGKFNQIALYGAGAEESNNEDVKNFSAYYFLTDSSGEFEEHDPSLWSATTVLLIDWELSISNKNEASTTI